ncbi:hypothetical protein LIER_13329 [Lithospermum erythrorhizon]|uniref:Reverse transcriptase domain-containing protein n=1 Tax=Lithospermum erythrorhizon TaxID=34254 RepID=A0AAV3PZL3_LITER
MVSMLCPIPFYQRGVDIVGDLPRTAGSKTYVIEAVDYFTKWVEAKPLPRQDQEQVYQFLKEIFTWFGVPGVSACKFAKYFGMLDQLSLTVGSNSSRARAGTLTYKSEIGVIFCKWKVLEKEALPLGHLFLMEPTMATRRLG